MNEAGYIRSIHRVLPTQVYRWKIADRFTVGVPDCWYSGTSTSLFIEYKYVTRVPKKVTAKLSEHQKIWLNMRYQEGRHVAVVVGSPNGGLILQNEKWNEQALFHDLKTPREIAAWITELVDGNRPKS